MGQKVLGVLYGCVVPEGLELFDSEDALLEKWGKSKANRKLGITTSPYGDKNLLGIWIAVGGDKDGVRDISQSCLPLTVIEKTKEAKQALTSWKKFVEWSKDNGVHIPSATFWLAPVEIA